MILEKGQFAWVVNNSQVEKVIVSEVRKTENTTTYFVKHLNGKKYHCTFNQYGVQNFRTFKDAMFARFHAYIWSTEKAAKRCAEWQGKEAA